MTRILTTILSLSLLVLSSGSSLAGGPPPPPGWGKAPPLPPANGTGSISFRQGGTTRKLPLQKIEISDAKGVQIVSLTFVDSAQKNRAEIAFGASAGKTGPVPDGQVTGIYFKSEGDVVSRGVASKTKCNLVLSKLSAKEVAGKASCAAMFKLDGTSQAPAVTAISFTAKAK